MAGRAETVAREQATVCRAVPEAPAKVRQIFTTDGLERLAQAPAKRETTPQTRTSRPCLEGRAKTTGGEVSAKRRARTRTERADT